MFLIRDYQAAPLVTKGSGRYPFALTGHTSAPVAAPSALSLLPCPHNCRCMLAVLSACKAMFDLDVADL